MLLLLLLLLLGLLLGCCCVSAWRFLLSRRWRQRNETIVVEPPEMCGNVTVLANADVVFELAETFKLEFSVHPGSSATVVFTDGVNYGLGELALWQWRRPLASQLAWCPATPSSRT